MNNIVLLVLSVVILYMIKPTFIYKPNGRLREYGVGYDKMGFKKTFFTFPIVILIIVIALNELKKEI